jgi:hypothetical protein
MLHIVKSTTDNFDPYRAIAPWIDGFEEPLRHAMNDAAALVTAADTAEWNGVLVPGLGAARRQASVARWRQGATAWRRWVGEVRGLRSKLAIDARAERLLAWLAFADFSYQAFPQAENFNGVEFPAGASFESAQFLDDAWFSGARFGGRANFRGARFCRDAFFEQSWFEGQADFQEAMFAGSVRLTAAVALAGIAARKAHFGSDLWMRSSQFFGPVAFAQARIGLPAKPDSANVILRRTPISLKSSSATMPVLKNPCSRAKLASTTLHLAEMHDSSGRISRCRRISSRHGFSRRVISTI